MSTATLPSNFTNDTTNALVRKTSAEFRLADQELPAETVRWSWACRKLDQLADWHVLEHSEAAPRAGDLVLAEVTRLRQHTRIVTACQERLRLYQGDHLVGVLGNRYATDAFEGEVDDLSNLHLLTACGLIGAMRSKHRDLKEATELEFRGFLSQRGSTPANLISELFQNPRSVPPQPNVVLVVGAGMNTGKTSTAAKLIKALMRRGLLVAGCKVTGSVSHRDLFELKSTGAIDARDFSDYGFPSTYLIDKLELYRLFETMRTDALEKEPDLIVMEIADGVLQRETAMLLADPSVRRSVAGIVLAAPCSLSALAGAEVVRSFGHRLLALSGVITNSPLFIREFQGRDSAPVLSSAGDAAELAEHVAESTLKVR